VHGIVAGTTVSTTSGSTAVRSAVENNPGREAGGKQAGEASMDGGQTVPVGFGIVTEAVMATSDESSHGKPPFDSQPVEPGMRPGTMAEAGFASDDENRTVDECHTPTNALKPALQYESATVRAGQAAFDRMAAARNDNEALKQSREALLRGHEEAESLQN
jgi:hypothetical protein